MKKIIRLTESDLTRLVRQVIKEQDDSSLPDCETFITTNAGSVREPIDPKMGGQGTVIKDVTISYNPTVSPNYRSITMSKNGVPFCSTKVG